MNIAEAVKLWQTGHSTKQIASKLECKEAAIYNNLDLIKFAAELMDKKWKAEA